MVASRRRTRSSTTSMTSMVSLSHFQDPNAPADAAKLDTVLEELDIEVESRCRMLLSQSQHLARQIRNALQVELVKLPKKIRQMPMEEFANSYGGDVNAVLLEDVKKLSQIVKTPKSVKKHKRFFDQPKGTPLHDAFSSFAGDTMPVKRTYNRKTTILAAQDDNDWIDEPEVPVSTAPASSKRGRGTAAAAVAEEQQQPKRRVTRASFRAPSSSIVPCTPASSGPRSVWDTPAQTPAFDPRLPFTPRNVRDGEMILSQNGSPLGTFSNAPGTVIKANGRSRNTVVIDMGAGEVNIASPSAVEKLAAEDRKEAVEKLQAIQDQVALLMSQLGEA